MCFWEKKAITSGVWGVEGPAGVAATTVLMGFTSPWSDSP